MKKNQQLAALMAAFAATLAEEPIAEPLKNSGGAFGDEPVENFIKCFVSDFKPYSKKNGEQYLNFNAYIEDTKAKFSMLIGGLRISKGKILPPTKFNPGTKKTFNTLYMSHAAAGAIYEELSHYVEGLDPLEEAIRSLVYTKEKYEMFLDIKVANKINVAKTATIERAKGN